MVQPEHKRWHERGVVDIIVTSWLNALLVQRLSSLRLLLLGILLFAFLG